MCSSQDDDLVSESEADDQVHTSDHVGEEGGHDEYSPSGDSTPEDKAPAVTEYEHAAKETGDQGRPEQEETTTWESFGGGCTSFGDRCALFGDVCAFFKKN